MVTKLLFSVLPEYYPPGSAYAHFPFMVPDTMREYIGKLECESEDDYTWTRPTYTPLGGSVKARMQNLVPHPLASVCLRKLFSSTPPTDCNPGEGTVILEQGTGALRIFVLPYHGTVDRPKIRVGYQLDDAPFERRRRCCESCPGLLDHRGDCKFSISILYPGC